MASRLPRRQLASYAADQIVAGNYGVYEKIAALLIHEKRTREVNLLARDIEDQLASKGQLVVRVKSARSIDASIREEIAKLFPDDKVHIKEEVISELIGGIHLATPTQILDQTIAKKLENLRKLSK